MSINYIQKLEQILAAKPYTQEELAQELGVSFAALNRWLNKRAVPHKRRIELIDRLHREIVGYNSISKKDILRLINEVKKYRNKEIWKLISSSNDLQDDLILEHTYNSTAIEGTTFTKKETEAVIFDKQSVSNKSLIEHLDVINYSFVLRKIFKGEFSKPVDIGMIKEIHSILMQGVRDDGGEFSKHQRGIRGVNIALTHPEDIPEEMSALLMQWNNTKQKNIHTLAKFHSDFELIHPFGDGNGRVGRLIVVLQCRKLNYTPVIIENQKKAEYYEVLEYAQRKSEYPFVQFLVKEMEQTFNILKKYM